METIAEQSIRILKVLISNEEIKVLESNAKIEAFRKSINTIERAEEDFRKREKTAG